MELLDVLDESGNLTGEQLSIERIHKEGIWHGAVHLLIINDNNLLIQKRAKTMRMYPSTWDISVGGHITAGEEALTSVRRELKEELGLNPDNYIIEFIDRHIEQIINNDLISNEYVNLYIIRSKINLIDIILQKSEVESIKWVSIEELNNMVINNEIVPHYYEYELLNDTIK